MRLGVPQQIGTEFLNGGGLLVYMPAQFGALVGGQLGCP